MGSYPSDMFHFRSVLTHMRRIYKGQVHSCQSLISITVHRNSFVGILLLREVFYSQFAACFWGNLSWDGLWGTACDSSNTLYYKCKYLHKTVWWYDDRLLQVLAISKRKKEKKKTWFYWSLPKSLTESLIANFSIRLNLAKN